MRLANHAGEAVRQAGDDVFPGDVNDLGTSRNFYTALSSDSSNSISADNHHRVLQICCGVAEVRHVNQSAADQGDWLSLR